MSQSEILIKDLIESKVESMGFFLVDLKFIHGQNKSVRVLVDKKNKGITVNECALINKEINRTIEEKKIFDTYRLEVSSPGIDRPLVKLEDFKNHIGLKIKIKLFELINTKRNYIVTLKEVKKDIIIVVSENQDKLEINFDNIKSAKLFIVDNMLKLNSKKSNQGDSYVKFRD